MPRITFVFFDHGGTLSFATKDQPEIIQDVLRENGYSFSIHNILQAIQKENKWWRENQSLRPRGQRKSLLVESNKVLLDSLGLKNTAYLAERMHKEWHAQAGFRLYSDVILCLNELRSRRMPMGVITQSLDTTEELARALMLEGLGHYFSVVATSESIGFDKPDARLFLAAAEYARQPPDSILYVGNRLDYDIKGATDAGMNPVLIDRLGDSDSKDFVTIHSLSELPQLLDKLKRTEE